jgi:predicted sugar kinase
MIEMSLLPEAVRENLEEAAEMAAEIAANGHSVEPWIGKRRSSLAATDFHILTQEYAFKYFVDGVPGRPNFEHFLVFYKAFLSALLRRDIFPAHFRLQCFQELDVYFQKMQDGSFCEAAKKMFDRKYQERLATRFERL